MPYLGQLVQANTYEITVKAETKVAVTVFNIRRDRISEVESLVLDPTLDPVNKTATTGPRTIGSNVGRVVIMASVEGGVGSVIVTQLSQTFPTANAAPDTNVVFDVV